MRYDAFISYSHSADGRLAPALQTGLQRLARPWHRRRALRVFRDETGLAVNPRLWDSIAAAMSDSRYFVLLASPDAAASPWVNREIEHWLATHTVDTVLPVLTDGTLVWNRELRNFDPAASSALPPALAGAFSEEPAYLDLRWGRDATQLDLRHSRFRAQIATLAAPMHGIARDDLEGEDVRLHRHALRLAGGVAAALVLLTVGALIAAGYAVSYAQTASEQRHRAVVLGARATREGVLAKTNAQLAKAQKRTAEANATRAALNATEAEKQTTLAQQNAAEATANASEAAANGARAQAKAVEAAANATAAQRNATAAQRSADQARTAEAAAKTAAAAAEDQRVLAAASEARAVAQRKIAEANAKTALSRQLAAEALYNIDPHPDLALLEAVEAQLVQPTREAVRSLVQSLLTHPEVRQLLSTSGKGPFGVQVAPDGRVLAAELADNSVQLWDLSTGTALGRQSGGTGTPVLGPFGLMARSTDTEVQILDVATGSVRERIPVDPTRELGHIAFSADGAEVAIATTPNPPDPTDSSQTINRWDITTSTAQPVGSAVVVGGGQWAFSPDGSKVAWGDDFSGFYVRGADGAQIGPLVVPSTTGNAVTQVPMSALFFSADGRTLVTASSDTDVTFWDTVTGDTHSVGMSSGSRTVLAVSPDQRVVAVVDSTNHLTFIDAATGANLRDPITLAPGSVFDSPIEMFTDVSGAFTPDSSTLVLTGPDNLVRLIDVAPAEPPLGHHVDLGSGDTTVSPDGTRAAVNSGADIKVVDLGSGKTVGTHPGGGIGEAAAFSPNGALAWADAFTATVTVWDPATGASHELATGFEFVTGIVFSPDGREIAVEGVSLAVGNQALFYDALTGTPLDAQPAIDGVVAVAFSPDGRTTATAIGGEIQLRSPGQLPRPLTSDQVCATDGGLGSVQFSPDGSTLAVGCMQTIELRSTASGTLQVPALEMGDGSNGSDPGLSLTFSRDGSLLAGGDFLGSLRVWDAVSGQLLGTPLTGNTAPVASLAFTDAGKLVSASAHRDLSSVGGEVIRWDFDPSSLERRACAIANRELTPDEWTHLTGNAAPYVSCAAILAAPTG